MVRISQAGARKPFVYPAQPVSRTAVLVPWFGGARRFGKTQEAGEKQSVLSTLLSSASRNVGLRQALHEREQVRLFPAGWPQGWNAAAERFAPASLAATFEQLIALSSVSANRRAGLTHALIVLSRPEWPALGAQRRDALWQIFGLPVFEQVIGPGGQLLATECEAHQGLHIETPGFDPRIRAGLGLVESLEKMENMKPCCCGRTTPRVYLRAPHRLAAAVRGR